MANFRQLRSWAVPGGLFHWVNALCILFLLQLGFIMMFREDLGLESVEAKIALKYIHSYIGFVFLANLAIRAVRGLVQKPASVRQYSLRSVWHYLRKGCSPARPPMPTVRSASRWVTLALFALFTLSAVTGLFRTGTDLYLPPVGPVVAHWLAESPDVADQIDPRSNEFINQQKLNQLNRIKVPVGWLHKFSAWAVLILVVVHVCMAYDFSRALKKPGHKYGLDDS